MLKRLGRQTAYALVNFNDFAFRIGYSAVFLITPGLHHTTIEYPSLRTEFARVSANMFQAKVHELCAENPRFRNELTLLDNYEGMECWIAENQSSGFAVGRDLELVNVFSKIRGAGGGAVSFAQHQYSQLHLNCYEPLEKFYTRHGFITSRREPNWDSTPHKPLPGVAYMEWTRK